MQTGQNFRSDVFLGNGVNRYVPEVVVTAAVVTPAGVRDGIIKSSLNLSSVGRIAGDLVDPKGTTLMVTDNRGMVIGAAGVGAPGLLAHVGGTPWVQSTLESGTGDYFAAGAEGHGGGRYVTARYDMSSAGWRIFVRRAVTQVERPVTRFYAVTAAWVLCSLIVAVPFARLTARRVTRPIEQLVAETEEISSRGLLASPRAGRSPRRRRGAGAAARSRGDGRAPARARQRTCARPSPIARRRTPRSARRWPGSRRGSASARPRWPRPPRAPSGRRAPRASSSPT